MPEIMAFTAEQVRRLTGLSLRQLHYWDKTGFYVPQSADEERHGPYSRFYSFRDLVGLRTIAMLRNQYRMPLHELRKVGAWLSERFGDPWSSLTFYVAGRRVFFDDPETGVRMAGKPLGQMVMPVKMERIAQETEAVDQLRERRPEDIVRVVQQRQVMGNVPVLAGTRIPTTAVLSFHEAGYDTEAIIREYPRLTPEDVRAAIAYEKQQQARRPGRARAI